MYIQHTRADSFDEQHDTSQQWLTRRPRQNMPTFIIIIMIIIVTRRHGLHFARERSTPTHDTLQLIYANSQKFGGPTPHTDTIQTRRVRPIVSNWISSTSMRASVIYRLWSFA